MSMCIREPRAAAASFALICGLLALTGCGETTQTVGRLGAESLPASGSSTSDVPRSSSAASQHQAGGAGSGDRSRVDAGPARASANAGTAGTASMPLAACIGPTTAAARRELDLYLLVDDLISIPPNTWTNLLHGLKRYVSDPRAEGTGVGVGFLGLACIADLYTTPSVEIAPLPDNVSAINSAIDSALPINLSSLQAAIEGSLKHARSFVSAHPERKLVLVLVTDSIADAVGCGDASSLSAAALAGATGTPAIATYVLAIVDLNTLSLALSLPSLLLQSPALAASPLGPLNQIAAAGSTGHAFPYSPLAEPNDNAQVSPFADTMVQIQHEAEPCDYAVPDAVPDSGAGARLMIDGSASAGPLPALAAQSDCGTGYVLTADSDGKRWARLCSATCADVKNARATLSWATGCP